MTKKNLFALLSVSVIICAGIGYYYFINYHQPAHFVKSFYEQLEFKRTHLVFGDFFISDYLANPSMSWDEYFAENKSTNLSEEEHFDNWI